MSRPDVRTWITENQGRYHCQCGCGEPIRLGRQHFHRGVPRFISGHNAKGRVHSVATRAKLAAQKRGAANPMYGRRAANFKGRTIGANGYILIHAPEHPHANANRKVQEHRLLLEAHLRETSPEHPSLVEIDGELYISRDWDVHHRNDVKDDNRIENLEAMTGAEHRRRHLPPSFDRRR